VDPSWLRTEEFIEHERAVRCLSSRVSSRIRSIFDPEAGSRLIAAMTTPERGINFHRPLRPGELTQRFRRIRATLPSINEPDTGGDAFWENETDEYWDPWRADHVRFGDWKIERTWNELLGKASSTLGERFPSEDWAGVPVVESGAGELPRRVTPARCRWCAGKLPSALRASIDELSRTGQVPLSPNFPAARTDISPFRHIAEKYALVDFEDRSSSMGGLVTALYLSAFWVRPPAEFVAQSDDLKQTVPDLMEHLFTVHPIAPCLRNAWFARADDEMPDLRWIAWFILAGQGASIQRAGPLFGWKASTSLVAHLPAAPANLSPTDGFIWADIERLGGGETEVCRLRAHAEYAYCPVWLDPRPQVLPDPQPHEFEDFLADTVRWLVRYRAALTDEMCRSILPWAAHLYRLQMHTAEHFTWKGRSPARAHRLAVEYERGIEMPYPNLRWRAKGYGRTWISERNAEWSVREIVTSRGLYEEGQAMSHCVAAYAMRCYQGNSVICSLRRGSRRRLTVEINPETLDIVQARGSCNRAPTPQEFERLQEWQIWLRSRPGDAASS
jgi:hypothetical protein